MKISFKRTLFCGLLILVSAPALANDFGFSIGGGYPFFVVPEVSVNNTDRDSRWYVNYKVGLDDGFSIGYEQAVFENSKHAMGAFLGAIGIHEEDLPCSGQTEEIECILDKLFDEEVTNGVGFSYTYFFKTINSTGWYFRAEAGYGEGAESKVKRSDASIRISYQF